MTINPTPTKAKIWDFFERRWYARRHILNIEWDSAYYSSSFLENWEWTKPKIQYFNFCSLARLREWSEESKTIEKEYKTTDLTSAATLVYLWKKLLKVEKISNTKWVFIFENDEDIDDIIFEMQFRKTIKVEPIEFNMCLKRLKNSIYQDWEIQNSFWITVRPK